MRVCCAIAFAATVVVAPAAAAWDKFPLRVHVFEDYEAGIEKRWWLRGTTEEEDVPESLSSLPNKRACRAAPSKDFDRKMGDQTKRYKAVVFNPVPGPPMGPNTRLSFRYKLVGTDAIRVQIYSLSKGYHRRLLLEELPQGEWQSITVDMTKLRRPDGSGGPLAEDERIDDIQFYIDPEGELLIDDIVLFEAAVAGESMPFPSRIIFTGWFDTGKQGAEWPGEFEIVPHEKPRTWDAAKAVAVDDGHKRLRVDLRGERLLGAVTNLRFDYKMSRAGTLQIDLAKRAGGVVLGVESIDLKIAHEGGWGVAECELEHREPGTPVTEIQFHPPEGADLLIDNLLLYEK